MEANHEMTRSERRTAWAIATGAKGPFVSRCLTSKCLRRMFRSSVMKGVRNVEVRSIVAWDKQIPEVMSGQCGHKKVQQRDTTIKKQIPETFSLGKRDSVVRMDPVQIDVELPVRRVTKDVTELRSPNDFIGLVG